MGTCKIAYIHVPMFVYYANCNSWVHELYYNHSKGNPPCEYTGQEVKKVTDNMTQAELILYLETLAELIESKAKTLSPIPILM